MTKEQVELFETDIAELFKAGKIKTPIHLDGGNLEQLQTLFKAIYKPGDWILSTWRNHAKWLYSGRSPEVLKDTILNHSSMHIYDDRFFTSAIVGGNAPIAVGLAMALKKQGSENKVLCFMGDMGAQTGIAMESIRYACGHDLPVIFIIEDNNQSVRTDSRCSWGCKDCEMYFEECYPGKKKTLRFNYKRQYNHAGPYENGDTKKVLF